MTDEKKFVTIEEAIDLLPDSEMIHTFRQAGPVIVGADHDRDCLIDYMRKAQKIEVTGEQAQAMGYGLAIHDEHGWLFIKASNYALDATSKSPLTSC